MLMDLMFGLKVALVGMSVTFIGLTFLIGLVYVNKFIAESVNKVGRLETSDVKKPVKTEKEPAAVTQKPATEANGDGVIAAITAAVSVVLEGKTFKLKSVKKTQAPGNSNAWDMVAIQEQNNNL